MPAKPFTNLDLIVESKVEFQFGGKNYSLRDIDARTFMTFTNSWHDLMKACEEKDKITEDNAFDILSEIILSVSEIPKEEVAKMTIAQMGVLISLIHQTVMGQDELKKKALTLREPQKTISPH